MVQGRENEGARSLSTLKTLLEVMLSFFPFFSQWTDRIFKWSHTALRSCLLFIPKTYAAANPNFQSRSGVDIGDMQLIIIVFLAFLLASDHNPVACGLALSPLSSQYSLPPVMFHDARVKGTQIQIPASSYSAKPKEAMSTSSGA